MKRESIVQFVCFTTNLGLDEFIPQWEYYAKRLMKSQSEPILQQLAIESKKKYRYISQHEGREGDFLFNFMKERHSEHFPEHNVRVTHAGGYFLHEVRKRTGAENNEAKLLVFTNQHEADAGFYSSLPYYRRLNIYEAYYENCVHRNIMEIFVPGRHAGELQQLLEQRPGTETGIYKESRVLHL